MHERGADVLNFGRRWEGHHNKIVDDMKNTNITYLYEKRKGCWFFN